MNRSVPKVLELVVPAEPQLVGQIRARVEEFLRPCRLSHEDVEGLKIALSEACSNAVCHGSPKGGQDVIRVRCEVHDARLLIEVTDSGCGFRPEKIALPDEWEWKASGRGLFLMQALTDHVEYEPTPAGTTVRLMKMLPALSDDAPPLANQSSATSPARSYQRSFAAARARA